MEAVDRRELTIHGPSNLLAMHSVSAAVLADRSQCIVRLSIPGRSKYNAGRNMPHIFMSIFLWAGGAVEYYNYIENTKTCNDKNV